jgi:hypothetical protein
MPRVQRIGVRVEGIGLWSRGFQFKSPRVELQGSRFTAPA